VPAEDVTDEAEDAGADADVADVEPAADEDATAAKA
jgi:hypothetical protein